MESTDTCLQLQRNDLISSEKERGVDRDGEEECEGKGEMGREGEGEGEKAGERKGQVEGDGDGIWEKEMPLSLQKDASSLSASMTLASVSMATPVVSLSASFPSLRSEDDIETILKSVRQLVNGTSLAAPLPPVR